jgi:hypothetical protein
MTKYMQDIKYLDNVEEIAKEFLREHSSNQKSKKLEYAEIKVGLEDIELKQGDTVRVIDKEYKINHNFKVTHVKYPYAKLKLIK